VQNLQILIAFAVKIYKQCLQTALPLDVTGECPPQVSWTIATERPCADFTPTPTFSPLVLPLNLTRQQNCQYSKRYSSRLHIALLRTLTITDMYRRR